jgi:hypothetical protein
MEYRGSRKRVYMEASITQQVTGQTNPYNLNMLKQGFNKLESSVKEMLTTSAKDPVDKVDVRSSKVVVKETILDKMVDGLGKVIDPLNKNEQQLGKQIAKGFSDAGNYLLSLVGLAKNTKETIIEAKKDPKNEVKQAKAKENVLNLNAVTLDTLVKNGKLTRENAAAQKAYAATLSGDPLMELGAKLTSILEETGVKGDTEGFEAASKELYEKLLPKLAQSKVSETYQKMAHRVMAARENGKNKLEAAKTKDLAENPSADKVNKWAKYTLNEGASEVKIEEVLSSSPNLAFLAVEKENITKEITATKLAGAEILAKFANLLDGDLKAALSAFCGVPIPENKKEAAAATEGTTELYEASAKSIRDIFKDYKSGLFDVANDPLQKSRVENRKADEEQGKKNLTEQQYIESTYIASGKKKAEIKRSDLIRAVKNAQKARAGGNVESAKKAEKKEIYAENEYREASSAAAVSA